jgi:hypothetical protein
MWGRPLQTPLPLCGAVACSTFIACSMPRMQNLKDMKIKEYTTEELNPLSYREQGYKATQPNHLGY